jgi:hypothetical protein
MTTKYSGIFYFSKDFSKLETKRQFVNINISRITYHRTWFPFLRGIIHNEFVLKDDQLTYMRYPRGLVVNYNNFFTVYGGDWLAGDLALSVLREFGYEEETDNYKLSIVEDYHKYLDRY